MLMIRIGSIKVARSSKLCPSTGRRSESIHCNTRETRQGQHEQRRERKCFHLKGKFSSLNRNRVDILEKIPCLKGKMKVQCLHS
jgi:hypothetical protein